MHFPSVLLLFVGGEIVDLVLQTGPVAKIVILILIIFSLDLSTTVFGRCEPPLILDHCPRQDISGAIIKSRANARRAYI